MSTFCSNYLFIFLYVTTATTLVSWIYNGLTCTPSNRNFPICTIIFQTETFHSKIPTKSFREWGWIKSMNRIIKLSKGQGEQVIYSTRRMIQLFFGGRYVVQSLHVYYSSLKIAWIGMTFLLSQVSNTMKTMNLSSNDFPLTLTD